MADPARIPGGLRRVESIALSQTPTGPCGDGQVWSVSENGEGY